MNRTRKKTNRLPPTVTGSPVQVLTGKSNNGNCSDVPEFLISVPAPPFSIIPAIRFANIVITIAAFAFLNVFFNTSGAREIFAI